MVEDATRRVLGATTVLETKAEWFAQESCAREAMRDLLDKADEKLAERVLLEHGTMLVKAESVVLRAVDRIDLRLRAAGFVPVVAWPLRLDRQAIRALWFYVLGGATLDRLDLLDLFKPATTSILLICRDERPDPGVPAAVRLQQFKGPTLPEQREPGDLRAGLGPANRLLNYVHAADEPADVLRELGLLFDRPTRRAVIDQLLAGEDAAGQLAAARDRAYAEHPAHDLEPRPALARLLEAIRRQCEPDVARECTALLSDILDLAPEPAEERWHRVHGRLWSRAQDLGTWDYVVVGSSVCSHDPAVGRRMIPDPVHGRWDLLWAASAQEQALSP